MTTRILLVFIAVFSFLSCKKLKIETSGIITNNIAAESNLFGYVLKSEAHLGDGNYERVGHRLTNQKGQSILIDGTFNKENGIIETNINFENDIFPFLGNFDFGLYDSVKSQAFFVKNGESKFGKELNFPTIQFNYMFFASNTHYSIIKQQDSNKEHRSMLVQISDSSSFIVLDSSKQFNEINPYYALKGKSEFLLHDRSRIYRKDFADEFSRDEWYLYDDDSERDYDLTGSAMVYRKGYHYVRLAYEWRPIEITDWMLSYACSRNNTDVFLIYNPTRNSDYLYKATANDPTPRFVKDLKQDRRFEVFTYCKARKSLLAVFRNTKGNYEFFDIDPETGDMKPISTNKDLFGSGIDLYNACNGTYIIIENNDSPSRCFKIVESGLQEFLLPVITSEYKYYRSFGNIKGEEYAITINGLLKLKAL